MAYIYAKAYNQTVADRGVVLFYENATSGVFDGVYNLTSTSTKIESGREGFKTVAATSGYDGKRLRWLQYPAGQATNSLLTMTSYTSSANVVQEYDAESGYTLTVIDPHGTHIGADTGDTASSQYVGAKHSTTDSGYVYAGAKVTLQASGYGSVVSTGGTTEGLVTTFPADYDAAIIVKLGTSSSYGITIEFLYEQSGPVTRTITLDANGGTVSPSSVSCTSTYANAVSIIPTRSGWQFIGWFDAASGGNEITGSTALTQSSPSTLYAHWEEIPVGTYAITYNPNGGSGGPESTNVTQGQSYTIPSTVPTRTSYTFDGWYVGEETTLRQPGYSFTPTGDTTITAQWSGGPRPPRPEYQKDYAVYGAGGYLNYSISLGSLVYAI